MASAITKQGQAALLAGDGFAGLPANTISLADQTATSSAQTLSPSPVVIKALVWAKTYTAGSGTVGPSFELQVADNAGFSTNVRTICSVQQRSRQAGSVFLFGIVPDNLSAATLKVVLTLSGTDALTYDALIQCS